MRWDVILEMIVGLLTCILLTRLHATLREVNVATGKQIRIHIIICIVKVACFTIEYNPLEGFTQQECL